METKEKIFLGIFIGSPLLALIPMLVGLNLLSLLVAIVVIVINLVLAKEVNFYGRSIEKSLRFPVLSAIFLIQFFNGVDWFSANISYLFILIFSTIFVCWFLINLLVKIIGRNSLDWYEVFTFSSILLAALPLILLLDNWGSQLIWMIGGFYTTLLVVFYLFGLSEYEVRFWNKKLSVINIAWGYVLFSLVVGVASTIIQYWGTAVQIILAVVVFLVIAFLIVLFISNRKDKKAIAMAKINEQKRLKKLEADEETRKRKEIQQYQENEKKRLAFLKKARELFFENFEKSASLNWSEVKRLFSERDITSDFFLKTPIFCKVSHYRKSIVFDDSVVPFMLRSFNNFYNSIADDDNSSKIIIDQFLKKIEIIFAYCISYSGYKSIVSVIKKGLDPDLFKKIDLNFKPLL